VVTLELVGGVEADGNNGRVSSHAPVGRALLGACTGDVIEVETPSGRVKLEVLEINTSSLQEGSSRNTAVTAGHHLFPADALGCQADWS